MKHARTNVVLLVCSIALGAFIFTVERRGDSPPGPDDVLGALLSFNPDRVSAIHVTTPEYTVEAVREGDRWRMVRPFHAPADMEGLLRLLYGIQTIPRHTVIRPEDLWTQALTPRDFGLDRPRAGIVLTGPGVDVRVDVGEPMGLGRVYIRLPDIDTILGADTNFLALVPSTVSAFRDRTLFPGSASDVRQIRIRRPAGYLQIIRGEGGTWRILQPIRARTDRAAAARLIDGILSARILNFVQDAVTVGSPYGLDETAMELTVDFDRIGAQSVAIQIGHPVDPKEKRVYARRTGGDSVFTVPEGLARLLTTPLDQLRDSRLVAMPVDEIGAVSIERESGRLRMTRSGDAWRIIEPIAADADAARVTAFLQEWTGTRVEEFRIASADFTNAPAGAARIALYRSSDIDRTDPPAPPAETPAPQPAVSLQIADSAEDLMEVVIQDADGLSSARVRRKPPEFLSVDPLLFRDRAVLVLDSSDVEGLILSRPGVEQRVTRDASGGFSTADGAVASGPMALRLQTLAALRAAAFVVHAPSELITYGLDPPAATLTVVLRGEGSPVRSLLFGRSVDGGVCAMFRGQNLVFLLTPEDAAALQADLVARTEPAGPAPETAP